MVRPLVVLLLLLLHHGAALSCPCQLAAASCIAGGQDSTDSTVTANYQQSQTCERTWGAAAVAALSPQGRAFTHLKTPGACSGMSDCSTLATTSRCCAVLRPFMISLLTRTKSSYVASSGTCTPAAQHSTAQHSTAQHAASTACSQGRVCCVSGAARYTRACPPACVCMCACSTRARGGVHGCGCVRACGLVRGCQ